MMHVRIQLEYMCSNCKTSGKFVIQKQPMDSGIDLEVGTSLEEYVPDRWAVVNDKIGEYTKILCDTCWKPEVEKINAAVRVRAREEYNECAEDFDVSYWYAVEDHPRGVKFISLYR